MHFVVAGDVLQCSSFSFSFSSSSSSSSPGWLAGGLSGWLSSFYLKENLLAFSSAWSMLRCYVSLVSSPHVYSLACSNSPFFVQPNCYAKVINVLGEEKIVIYAKRDIEMGMDSELWTYMCIHIYIYMCV
jgi:hypothetical protein